jgi:hypothetical protein
MFQILRDPSGDAIRVCRTVEDAHRWLGLE